MAASRREYSIQSVVRSFNIVQEIADAGDETGAQQISNALKLHISTVFRFLQTLTKHGVVERNPRNGKYRLGMKLLDWGMRVLRQMDLRRDALPYLRELNESTGQTVHMAVYDRGAAIYIEKIHGPTPLRGFSEIGKAAPLHCTGVGKALMAALSPVELAELLNTYQLRRFTPNTIINVGTLKKELQRIRTQGLALDNEEHEPGIRCVAAPIQNHTGKVVASISVAGRTTDITPSRMPRLIQAVKETAQKIGARLGHGSVAEKKPASNGGRYGNAIRTMAARQR
jgi:DNA-binding IclR family transcriptional regulator